MKQFDRVMGYKPNVEMMAALIEGINHFNFLPVANPKVNDSSAPESRSLSMNT